MVKTNMVGPTVSLPSKWEIFLKHLARDHGVDLNAVVSELFEWAFSNAESEKQFAAWLDDAFPSMGEAEEETRAAGEEAGMKEEEGEEESEDESHEHRDEFP